MASGTAATVIRQLSKKLIITAIVIGMSIMIMQINQALGIILMMLYSSWMVISSSKKEMPLTKLTALLPGAMSLICFLAILSFLGVTHPIMPMIGCGAGLIFGFLMTKGHKIYIKKGVVYSQRTLLYISLWVCSILFTQGSTLMGIREIVDFGLLLNGFSATGMVVLSLLLIQKANTLSRLKNESFHCLSLGLFLAISSLITFQVSHVFNDGTVEAHAANTSSSESGVIIGLCGGAWEASTKKCTNHRDCGTGKCVCQGIPEAGNPYTGNICCYKKKICPGHHATCYNPKGRGYSEYTHMVWDKNEDGTCDICGGVYGALISGHVYQTYGRYKYILKGNGYHTCKDISDISSHQPTPQPNPFPNPDNNSHSSSNYSNRSSNNTNNSSSSSPNHNNYTHFKNTEFSDEAAAAGIIAAIIQILLGLGLNGATAVVQPGVSTAMASATRTKEESQENASTTTSTIMLSGTEALEWMKDPKNGYMNDVGFTQKFRDFENLLPSQKNPDLQGIAFYHDENGHPIGDFTIIVASDPPPRQPEAESEQKSSTEPEKKKDPITEYETEKEPENKKDPVTPPKTSPPETEKSQKEKRKEKEEVNVQPVKQEPAQPDDRRSDKTSEKESPVEFPNAKEDLEKIMEDIIKQKTKEGYYVTNPKILKKAWNGTLGGVINWLSGYKGGSCGDFASGAEWNEKTEGGIKWSEGEIKALFGEGALVTDITCERPNNWIGPWNHSATKVILPNGERYVLDYWEGMQTKKSTVYPEDEWLSKWKNKMYDKSEITEKSAQSGHVPGSLVAEFWENVTEVESVIWETVTPVIYDDLEVLRSMEERTLKNNIENLGPKRGEDYVKKKFIDDANNKELAASIIKSWEKDPW